MGKPNDWELPKFVMAVIEDPEGYKPGRYYYVLYLPTNTKVSRYLRNPHQVQRKIRRYEEKYRAGDRDWPEVDRCDELRDSTDAIPTHSEKVSYTHVMRCLGNVEPSAWDKWLHLMLWW